MKKAGKRPHPRVRIRGPYAFTLLLLIYVIARLPFLDTFDLVSFDGTFYLNQAKAFFRGSPPGGSFPVGYPFFTALLIPLVDDAVTAGRLVSFLAGLGSVAILYKLAKRHMSGELALACALSFSVVPLFIRLSLTTFSESLYVFWILAALLLYGKQRHLAAGLALGAAAVTRPEALGIVAVLMALRLRAPRQVVRIALGCAVIYSLNVVTFYSWFGKLELLPKSEFLGASADESWRSRERRVDRPWESDVREMIAKERTPTRVSKEFLTRLPPLALLLTQQLAFVLVLLAVLGIVARPSYLLAAFLPLLAIPLFTVRDEARYLLPYLPIAILFAFAGVDSLSRRYLARLGYALLVLSVVLGFVLNRDQLVEPVDEGHYDLKMAGLALKGKIRKGSKIADRKPYLPFYAEGLYIELPSGAYDDTMQYLSSREVDYLVLHDLVIRKFRPQLWPLASDAAVVRGESRFVQYSKIGDHILLYKRKERATPLEWTMLTDEFGGFDSSPAWSPDGTRIAYVSTRQGNADIKMVSSNGIESHTLVDWPSAESSPSWSPDGTRIVFASNRGGTSTLFSIEVATGETQQLTTRGADTGPSWSRDGREIVFLSDRSGTWQVWIKNIATGRLTQISSEHDNAYPTMSPDGERLAWIRRPGQVVIYNRRTEETAVAAEPSNANYAPAWSPDGSYLAVTAKDWGSVDVYVLSSDGSRALLFTKRAGFDGQPSWGPDGVNLAIASERGDGRGIWTVGPVRPFASRLTEFGEVWTLKD